MIEPVGEGKGLGAVGASQEAPGASPVPVEKATERERVTERVTGYRALIRFPDTCPQDQDPHAAHTLPKPLQYFSPWKENALRWLEVAGKGLGEGVVVELWEQVEREVELGEGEVRRIAEKVRANAE